MSELYHYGRKGMKWGQHIFGKDSKNTGANRHSKDEPKKSEIKKTKKFSDYHSYREYLKTLSAEQVAKSDMEYSSLASKFSRSSITASESALRRHKAGEDAKLVNKDLDDARRYLKKAENTARYLSKPDDFLRSDFYLEPKWAYEDAHDRIRSDRGEKFVRKFSG